MKNEWEKQWEWNNNACMHSNRDWLNDHKDFPIFWYHCRPDVEVWYIKQLSKTCGIIHDQNYYGPVREKSAVAKLAKRSVQKFVDKDVADYHTMKSWSTLGVSDEEPMEEVVYMVRPNGGGYIMKFHPVTKKWIQKIHINDYGEVEYRARSVVKRRENHLGTWFEEIEYENSEGDHFRKLWNENKKRHEWQKL
jgi:hypothetical protein